MKYFYAYSTQNEKNVVESWDDCKKKINGKKARYKKFPSKELAESWLKNDFKLVLPKGVYFDAGTGGGEGTEVRVTDNEGFSLLLNTNSRGNINLRGETNNFGELTGMFLALEIAMKTNTKKVFGDSKLVLDFWSKGFISQSLPEKTIQLAYKTSKLRELFESSGGVIEHVSGDINPADLGFHK
jgi:ribonuclease HI